MTPFLQARLWAKEAPRSEFRLTCAVVAVLLALLAWALVPTGQPDEGGDDVATGGELSSDGSGGVGADGTAPGGTGPGGTGPGGTGPGGTGPGGTGPGGTGPGGTGTGPGGATSGGQGPGGTTGGPSTTATTTPVRRIASDQGVTADTVKVGFAMFDLGGVTRLGLAVPGLREDIPQVIDALVDHANKTGGVHGRKIVAAKRRVDIINPDQQRASCVQFNEEDKVFGIVDTFMFAFTSSRACITKEAKLPFVSGGSVGTAFEVRDHAPYQAATTADFNRQGEMLVKGAQADGFFDAGQGFRKLGLLTDDCDRRLYEDASIGLKAYLRQAGITTWDEYVASCDFSQSQSAGPAAVVQMKDDVTHVLFATNTAVIGSFLNHADTQQWRPKYYVSDLYGLASSGVVANHNPNQWDGVRGISYSREGDLRASGQLSPRAKECSKILTDRGLAPVDTGPDAYIRHGEALLLCDTFDVFLRAARRTPVNLKRPDWGAAIQQLGEVDTSTYYPAHFARGQFTGAGRSLAVRLQWRRDCKCYHKIRGPEPLTF